MRTGARILAGVRVLPLVACVAAASCRLATSGLGEVAADAGPLQRDATADDDAAAAVEAEVGAAADAAAQDGGEPEAASPADAVADSPAPTCTGCGPMSCCNVGTCAMIGDQTCGDPGQTCVDCTTASSGSKCIMLAGHQVCGCAGPPSASECPADMACHNLQCGAACDGQHPCNGGCCSGNDLASSTCVAACPAGMACTGNFCQ